jgi:branched-chain amino acid transport system substrate-binding protein
MRTSSLSRVAAAAVAALVMAACGSSSDDEASTGSAAPTAAATTKPAEAPAPDTTAAAAPDTTVGAAPAPAGDCALDEPLKLGYVADTGVGGIGDIPATAGAKFKVKQLNDAGGVGGKPIELEVKEISNDDAAAGQRAARELIDGGADIILGPPFSNFGLAILEETKGELPAFFVTSTEVPLVNAAGGSFVVSFSDHVQGSASAEYALKSGAKNAVLLTSQDIPYLNIPPGSFGNAFEQGGGTVQANVNFALGATDFSEQVAEIAALDPQPDVIYSSFFMPDSGVFEAQLREAGVESVVYSADGYDASAAWTAGSVTEGSIFTTHTFITPGSDVEAFMSALIADTGDDSLVPAFAALGGDAVMLAAAAVNSVCSLDGAELVTAVQNLENVPVVTGTTTYKGTNGSPMRDVTLLTVKDGAPAFLDAFFPAVVAED